MPWYCLISGRTGVDDSGKRKAKYGSSPPVAAKCAAFGRDGASSWLARRRTGNGNRRSLRDDKQKDFVREKLFCRWNINFICGEPLGCGAASLQSMTQFKVPAVSEVSMRTLRVSAVVCLLGACWAAAGWRRAQAMTDLSIDRPGSAAMMWLVHEIDPMGCDAGEWHRQGCDPEYAATGWAHLDRPQESVTWGTAMMAMCAARLNEPDTANQRLVGRPEANPFRSSGYIVRRPDRTPMHMPANGDLCSR
jgi:hypothetical protein